jgi:hypothetical protein
MAGTTHTEEVEYLRGGEITPFGEVAYIIQESDGVDVVFIGVPSEEAPCFHFDYGTKLEIIS